MAKRESSKTIPEAYDIIPFDDQRNSHMNDERRMGLLWLIVLILEVNHLLIETDLAFLGAVAEMLVAEGKLTISEEIGRIGIGLNDRPGVIDGFIAASVNADGQLRGCVYPPGRFRRWPVLHLFLVL
jgi:hypothetical protein